MGSKKKKGGKKKPEKKDGKPQKASEVWESLAYTSKKVGKELGFTPSNPLVDMFEEAAEEKKDEFPSTIVIAFDAEPLLMDVLSKALVACDYDGLRCLRFWNCGIGDVGVKFICQGLLKLPNLVQLDICDSLVGPIGCGYLAGYLRKISYAKVKTVKLDYNNIGSEGLKILCDGLLFNSALTKLSLAYCNIDAKGGAELARVLSRRECSIQKLNLAGNELGSKGIINLAELGIAKNRTLQKLDISVNKFGGEVDEMTALCKGFKSCTTLSQINMDGNLIKNDGLKFLIENLHDCTHIWDLDVTAAVDTQLLKMLHEMLNKNMPKKSKGKKGSKKKKKRK